MGTPENNHLSLPTEVVEATLDVWSRAGEQHLLPILGRSMLPLIRAGDQVLVAHGWANVRRGDVIVFLQEKKMVAHRLLRIHKDDTVTTFITKGDNVPYLDPPVSDHQVVGRVLKIERDGRWLSIDTPIWRRLGWLIAVSMLVWITFYNWGRRLRHRLWGEQPNHLASGVQRSTRNLSSFLLRVIILTVTFRWRH